MQNVILNLPCRQADNVKNLKVTNLLCLEIFRFAQYDKNAKLRNFG